MKLEHFKGALLHGRNILAFVAALIAGNYLLDSWMVIDKSAEPYVIMAGALLVYTVFVGQSLMSAKSRAEFEKKDMIKKVRKMSADCYSQARSMKRRLSVSDQKRLGQVIADTEEVVNSFFNSDKSYLKLRIVEKTLGMTALYTKMFSIYLSRLKSSDAGQISHLARRINTNTSNLNTIRDHTTRDEVRKVIANDEKVIESLKNERIEVEKLNARLQYMESTISMLRYNIISNIESEDILSALESEVSEADALNTVLNERYEEKRSRSRVHN
jgi:hypothetical protein